MRIVGGRLRGRRLPATPPPGVRPTSDRVREALSSALEARGALQGARVLDLFAGTGALSFEALSRGAARAVQVEGDARARRCLERNARELDLDTAVDVFGLDLLADPTRAARVIEARGPFDLIFADPPYSKIHEVSALLDALLEASLLAEGGLVVLEGPSSEDPPKLRRLAPVRVYRYGDTLVSLLEPTQSP